MMKWYLLSLMLVLILPPNVEAREFIDVHASNISDQILKGEDIYLENVHIIGIFNLNKLELNNISFDQIHVIPYNASSIRNDTNIKIVESEIIIKDSVFEDDVDFSNSIFEKRVDFSNTIFQRNVDFSGSNFSNDVNFFGARFDNKTIFQNVNFNGYTSFKGSDFNGNVFFCGSRFYNITDFNFVHFYGWSNFGAIILYVPNNNYYLVDSVFWPTRNTIFYNETWFVGAIFERSTNFRNISFNLIYFSHANFKDHTDFSNAIFNDVSDFSNASFETAIFQNVIFNNDTIFWPATFNSNAYFINTSFNGDALFIDSNFNSDVYFTSASFNNITDFTESSFKGDTYFNYANFEDYTSFNDVDFGDETSFINADINGSISFADSKFDELDISWNSLEHVLVYDGAFYVKLIKNFRNLEQYNDADNAYYKYQDQNRKNDGNLWDYLMYITCGYGVKPQRTAIVGIFLIMVFFPLIFFILGMSKSEALECSFIAFINGYDPHIINKDYNNRIFQNHMNLKRLLTLYWTEKFRKILEGRLTNKLLLTFFLLLEKLMGWFVLALFLVTLTNVMIKP
jgi:pentapeptide repeat protein